MLGETACKQGVILQRLRESVQTVGHFEMLGDSVQTGDHFAKAGRDSVKDWDSV